LKLALEKTSTSRGYRMTLFSAGKDSAKEKWDGARWARRVSES
jgi:intermediate cleaving peptidase 55